MGALMEQNRNRSVSNDVCRSFLAYTQSNRNLALGAHRIEQLVAVNAAPRGDVVQNARIGGQHVEYIAGRQRGDALLRTDYGHWAQQPAGVELMQAHKGSPIPLRFIRPDI